MTNGMTKDVNKMSPEEGRPMTAEEEAEYLALEESMSFHEGGGDWRGETETKSEVEEKPWFEREDQADHDRDR